MSIELTKEETADVLTSLKRYAREELELDLGDLPAKFLLEYFMKEIAPFAYNRGVRDAEIYFRARVEDLPAVCFKDGLTYWREKKGAAVRPR